MSSAQQRKRVVILGSTGSIGENALRILEAFPDRFEAAGLAAHSQVNRLLQQARRFNVKRVCLTDEAAASRFRELAPAIDVLSGPDGLAELAADEGADLVLVAVVGIAGLKPVLAALNEGVDVALATKEALVVAGRIVVETAARTGARLIPVDSEHSAIMQCLQGVAARHVSRLILTASGGPFLHKSLQDMEEATVTAALNHPKWKMGRKITVDSATMMNKGLELMEARWLFDVPVSKIAVLVHPECVVHSMVEFVDGSILAQLASSDMKLAIQYALTYPARLESQLPVLDLAAMGALHFMEPDEGRFPCLRLAKEAAEIGGTMPAVLNAANETAVREFLKGNLSLPGIGRVVEEVMARHEPVPDSDLSLLFEADAWAYEEASRIIRSRAARLRG